MSIRAITATCNHTKRSTKYSQSDASHVIHRVVPKESKYFNYLNSKAVVDTIVFLQPMTSILKNIPQLLFLGVMLARDPLSETVALNL